jgi:chorismate mutase
MTEISLEHLRGELKKTDREIVRLLNERAALSIKVGRIKENRGLDVYDAAQEAKIFEYLKEINGGSLPEENLKIIFKEILSSLILSSCRSIPLRKKYAPCSRGIRFQCI